MFTMRPRKNSNSNWNRRNMSISVMKISCTEWERGRASESLVEPLDRPDPGTMLLDTPMSLGLIMGSTKKFSCIEDSIKRNLLLKIVSRTRRHCSAPPSHLRRKRDPHLQKADPSFQKLRINQSQRSHSLPIKSASQQVSKMKDNRTIIPIGPQASY